MEPGGSLVLKWRAKIGEGYSGISVANQKVVTLFSDGKNQIAVAFDSSSGTELWRSNIGPTYKGHDGSHEGPIATPLIDNDRVYYYDPFGKLFALDLKSGKELWAVNIAEQMGAPSPFYGFASSPLMAAGVLIVEAGAGPNRAVLGIDPDSGKVRWSAGDDQVNYQSAIVINWKNSQQVLACGQKKLLALDPTSGRVLWQYEHQGEDRAMAAETLVPVPAGEGYLFLKNKQDSSTMIHISESAGGTMQVETVWSAGVLKGTYSMPVYYKGYLYGYNGRTVLQCVDAKTGEMKWRTREPGDGFLLLVNGNLVVQTKVGTLHIGPASPDGWKEIARLDLFKNLSWTNPSFAEGAIFTRSHGEIARVEWASIQASKNPATVPGLAPSGSDFSKTLERIAAAPDKKKAVNEFLSSIHSFPLVEWPDYVHFLYNGEAKDMGIWGDIIGDRREDPMHHVPNTDLFYYSIRLEPDARINYYYIRNYDETIVDPRNSRKAKDQISEYSWMAMPGWKEPDHLKPAPAARQGKIEPRDLKLKSWEGATVKLDVYLPVGYQQRKIRYPVVYIFAGPDSEVQQIGFVKNTLDNTIGQVVRPLIAVFVSPINYGAKEPDDFPKIFEVTSAAVVDEIVPLIDGTYRTSEKPSERAAMAAGFGGSAVMYVVFKHPGVFGNFVGQSVGLVTADEEILKKTIRTYSEQPLRIYFEWGNYEVFTTRENYDLRVFLRNMNALLIERGYKPAGGEVHDSSGWNSWRNRTDRWLMALFPMQK